MFLKKVNFVPGDVAWVPMSRFFFFSYHSRCWLEEVGTEWHHQIHVKDIATYRPNWPNGPIQWQLCAKKTFLVREKKICNKKMLGKKSLIFGLWKTDTVTKTCLWPNGLWFCLPLSYVFSFYYICDKTSVEIFIVVLFTQ